MRLIGKLIPLLFALNAHAAEAPHACAPSIGLSIGGISLSDTRASAAAKLGKPKATGTYQGEDDGGVYTGRTLRYAQIELDVDELRGIERIASTGPGAKLPFGLKAGLPLEQVAALLHFVPGPLDKGRVVLPICQADDDAEMRLYFKDGGLSSVEVVQYGP
ncbi:hypothetical protein LJR168_003606 [Pseudoxanthomonas sp. LjRoot168]|uniref:hypothetical protein n=1 Tax=unclassified Pseudoxanthomonas TaxID=2645906 RepID=UPI003ECE7462